jgi:hypothetical protein
MNAVSNDSTFNSDGSIVGVLGFKLNLPVKYRNRMLHVVIRNVGGVQNELDGINDDINATLGKTSTVKIVNTIDSLPEFCRLVLEENSGRKGVFVYVQDIAKMLISIGHDNFNVKSVYQALNNVGTKTRDDSARQMNKKTHKLLEKVKIESDYARLNERGNLSTGYRFC